MEYILVQNNNILYGPRRYNQGLFQYELDQEEIEYTLPLVPTIIVTDDFKLLPVTMTQPPEHNPKIQYIETTFMFTDTEAISQYEVKNKNIDLVKFDIKQEITAKRYSNEVGGVKFILNGQEVSLDTSRENRNIYLQAYQSNVPTMSWKFTEGWFDVTNSDLGNIVNTIIQHVQECFSWEKQKHELIDAMTTLQELNEFDINGI